MQSLTAAAHLGDAGKLREGYAAITASLASQSAYRAGPETLVLCAETAIQVRSQLSTGSLRAPARARPRQLHLSAPRVLTTFSSVPAPRACVCLPRVQVKQLDIAKRCLETYFLEIRRSAHRSRTTLTPIAAAQSLPCSPIAIHCLAALTIMCSSARPCCAYRCRHASGASKVEVKDQYLVRAHYALGKLISELSQGLKVRSLPQK